MITRLKEADRTLLEMHTGILVLGIVGQLGGLLAAGWLLRYSLSLWIGILAAVLASCHMGRTLDRALSIPENAAKILTAGYVLRYTLLAVLLILVSVTEVLNPIVMFCGYMSLKVTAYLQPITHKCYNNLFHETDPVPEPVMEDAEELICGTEENTE